MWKNICARARGCVYVRPTEFTVSSVVVGFAQQVFKLLGLQAKAIKYCTFGQKPVGYFVDGLVLLYADGLLYSDTALDQAPTIAAERAACAAPDIQHLAAYIPVCSA
jgi:hypothetical protein